MLKQDAINFFGNKTRVAKAAGVDPSAVSQWGELIPEKNAFRLQMASGHVLQYKPEIYDNHAKSKRSGGLKHENQPVG